jgi:MoxR-like ATPase
LSDRRIVKTQRLVAAATVLAGRSVATEADLWPLFYVMPTREAQAAAQDALRDTLALAANPTLLAAVEQAALQPLSRVARLLEAAQRCLADDADAAADARTAADAVLREIDANFTAASMPHELAAARARLIERIGAAA